MSTKKVVLLSSFTALSIVLNWMENIFFPWTILPIPGAKIGLANIVFLIILIVAGLRMALILSVLRVFFLGIFTGTLATVIFPLSLGGAVLSILFMKAARFFWGDKLSVIGLSIVGAVGHNLGQFGVLSVIPGLFPGLSLLYILLPGLFLLAIPAGILTGWIAGQILPVVKNEWEAI